MRVTQKLGTAVLLAQSVVSLSIPFPHFEGQQKHNPILAARGELNAALDDYDYVVVGSGPGGGPTAANLAVAGFKVLLIDAGGDQGDAVIESVPALNLASTAFAETEWAYYVSHHDDLAQQKRDSKMVYERADGTEYVGLTPPAGAKPLGILYPRAGTLGGCSRHNALITIQAFDSDWDNIAQLTGDASWKADKMRKYFEKIEKVNYIPRSSSGHGHDGWLDTSLTSLLTVVKDLKLISLIAASASAFGQTVPTSIIKTITGLAGVLSSDINAPGQLLKEGVYQIPLSIRDSKRGGARDWILEVANAVNRDGSRKYHLDLKLNTLVTKILFDESGAVPRATGVEFLEGKSLYRADRRSKTAAPTGSGQVAARREVIVAGGAFNTPQLLKLSGVGPRAELARFGIPVVADRPGVGANLQDRYEQTVITESPTNFTLTDGCTFGTDPARDPCLRKWLDGGSATAKGVYASNGIALGIIKKSSVAEGGDPDLIITGGPASFPGYYPGWADDAIAKHNVWSWIVLKGHTRNNAGTVTLRSADPRDPPSIDFRSFAVGGAADLQAVAEGLEWARHASDSVVPLDGDFTETWPGRAAVAGSAQLQAFTRDEAWGHHASCTCPIGADSDPEAVLDADFRVRGVAGLRVVDASVFPKIPGFYIALPTYLIAEKASEAIIRAARAA